MIHRRPLYWGVFLMTAGGIMLAGQAGLVDARTFTEAARLWPLIPIAIGVALLVRRTRLGLAGGMIAAAMPGLLLGGAVVAAPDITTHCRSVTPGVSSTQTGTFGADARVDVRIACGDLEIATHPGSSWEATYGEGPGLAPSLDVASDRMTFRYAARNGSFHLPSSGETAHITLPTDPRLDLSATVDAGAGRLDLTGARLGNVDLTVDAGSLSVDLTGSTLDHLVVAANAAETTVTLPSSDLSAALEVNAGKLSICTPADLGVRIREDTTLGSASFSGLTRVGGGWETPDYASRPHHADLTVSVNIGSVALDSKGGCK